MTVIEWIKYELRQRVDTESLSANDHKINFLTDIIIHATEPSVLRMARKYHGLLCHFDTVGLRTSKGVASKKREKGGQGSEHASGDTILLEAESGTKKSSRARFLKKRWA